MESAHPSFACAVIPVNAFEPLQLNMRKHQDIRSNDSSSLWAANAAEAPLDFDGEHKEPAYQSPLGSLTPLERQHKAASMVCFTGHTCVRGFPAVPPTHLWWDGRWPSPCRRTLPHSPTTTGGKTPADGKARSCETESREGKGRREGKESTSSLFHFHPGALCCLLAPLAPLPLSLSPPSLSLSLPPFFPPGWACQPLKMLSDMPSAAGLPKVNQSGISVQKVA